MAEGEAGLTGTWHGTFRYPRGAGPDTPFIATITDQAGTLAGTIIEPNEFEGGETAVATLAGHHAGRAVDFTKVYHGAGEAYENPVDYVGHLSADGDSVTGVWSLFEADGTFEMFREDSDEELAYRSALRSVILTEGD